MAKESPHSTVLSNPRLKQPNVAKLMPTLSSSSLPHLSWSPAAWECGASSAHEISGSNLPVRNRPVASQTSLSAPKRSLLMSPHISTEAVYIQEVQRVLGKLPEPAIRLNRQKMLRIADDSAMSHLSTLGTSVGTLDKSKRPSGSVLRPSNRSEAVRLTKLLDSVLAVEGGGSWERQCDLHSEVFADLSLQVGVQCAERGELLERIRKFYISCFRWYEQDRGVAEENKARMSELLQQVKEQRVRADTAEIEASACTEKLSAMRAGMVRMKILRAVHARRIEDYKKQVSEMDQRVRDLMAEIEQMVADRTHGSSRRKRSPAKEIEAPSERALPEPELVTRSTRRQSVVMSASGIDTIEAQLRELKEQLAAQEAVVLPLKQERDELERALRASEQEIAALMAALEQASESQRLAKSELAQLRMSSEGSKRELQDELVAMRKALEVALAESGRLEKKNEKLARELSEAEETSDADAERLEAIQKEHHSIVVALRWQLALKSGSDAQASASPTYDKTRTDVGVQTLPSAPSHAEAGPSASASLSPPELSAASSRKRLRVPLVTGSLAGTKSKPQSLLHKYVGALLHARLEIESAMDAKDENADDLLEFVEERFVEMYGLKKLAVVHLREFARGLQTTSSKHARLHCFRLITGLVPGDKGVSAAASKFYRYVLRVVAGVVQDSQAAEQSDSAFWAHFCRATTMRLPFACLERCSDELAAALRKVQELAQPAGQRLSHAKKLEEATLALESFEMAMSDLEELCTSSAALNLYGSKPAPLVLVGSVDAADDKRALELVDDRVCLDTFLQRALLHWQRAEKERKEQMLSAYRSWDDNNDGVLQFGEFCDLISFCNPGVTQSTITKVFMASSRDEQVDFSSLAQALLEHGLQLVKKPPDFSAPLPASQLAGKEGAERIGLLPTQTTAHQHHIKRQGSALLQQLASEASMQSADK